MVGIITHVTALADRIPIRYTVTRDNRSSRVERGGMSIPVVPDPAPAGRRMRFDVDSWDPSYGTSVEEDLGPSDATVDAAVELPPADWRPVHAVDCPLPETVLFVDGVRRIEARAWIDDLATEEVESSPALCASFAAGVLCCCQRGSHLLTSQVRRRLVAFVTKAVDIRTSAGVFEATYSPPDPAAPAMVTLSNTLQARMSELELIVAVSARSALPDHGVTGDADLLVIDGPMRGRTHLPRTLGFIKTHRASYLPPDLHAMVGTLGAGQRTPVFLMASGWQRYSWYLRLPCPPGHAWAGVVRIECSPDLSGPDAIAMANLSQVTLCRYASVEYKDSRAPQNLYPIAGLERDLRRRLGDNRLLYRALRAAAG